MILGYHVIIAVTVFLAAGLIVTYSMSVSLGHVQPLWCFISYTGNYGVEGCIFSLVLNLSAAIYVFIVFLRYLQVLKAVAQSNLPEKKTNTMKSLNLTSLLLGMAGAFGLSMTGCFQQRIFHLLHIIGVIFCTYFTLVFLILQTYFTYLLPPLAVSRPLKILRTVVVALSSCILACGPVFCLYYLVHNPRRFEIFEAPSSTGDNVGYRIGAALEWILFILNQMFICSFCPDFKRIALKKDEIVFL